VFESNIEKAITGMEKNRHLRGVIIVLAVIFAIPVVMFFAHKQSSFSRQLQGPIEGTDSVITVDGKLFAVSKENHIYTWQWGDLSIWPVVAKPIAQTAVPIAEDKIIYNPSTGEGKLMITNLEADKELASLFLPYDSQCKKIRTSRNGRYGAVSVLFKQGSQKGWFKLGLFGPDLKDISFVFQRNTDAENFLVYDFDITDNGDFLAGAGEKSRAWVFVIDVKNENILWEKGFPEYGQFTSAKFTPDGKTLFVAEKVRFIVSLDSATGQTIRVFEIPLNNTPANLKQNISCIAISPDNEILAAATEPAGAVWFWDATSGREISRLSIGSGLIVSGIAFSPDSQYLATSCMVSPEIKIWKVPKTAGVSK
jgi:WD40 repeat protein